MERGAKRCGFTAAQSPAEAPTAPPLPNVAKTAAETAPLVALADGRSGTRATTPNRHLRPRPEYEPILMRR